MQQGIIVDSILERKQTFASIWIACMHRLSTMLDDNLINKAFINRQIKTQEGIKEEEKYFFVPNAYLCLKLALRG